MSRSSCADEHFQCSPVQPSSDSCTVWQWYFFQMPRNYACRSENDCPGGLQPGECPTGHEGVACAECSNGYVRTDLDCASCEDMMAGSVLTALAVGLVCFCVAGKVVQSSASKIKTRYMTTVDYFATAVGIFVEYLQMMSLFILVNVEWPGVSRGVLDGVSIFNFDISLLSTGCYFGNSYALEMLTKPYYLLLACVFACGFWIAGWSLPEKWVLASKIILLQAPNAVLVNAVGLLSSVFFVPIAMQGFTTFSCYPHPEQGSSMMKYPGVLCFEDAWVTQVLPCGLLCIVVTISIYSTLAFLTYRSPTMSDASDRLKFMLGKYRPEAFMWKLVTMTRNLLISASPALTHNSFLQVMIMTLIVLGYMSLLARWWVWKTSMHNIADVTTSLALIVGLNAGVAFSQYSSYPASLDQKDSSWVFLSMATVIPLFVTVCVAFWVTYHGIQEARQERHQDYLKQLLQQLQEQSCRLFGLLGACSENSKNSDASIVSGWVKDNGASLSYYDLDCISDACNIIETLILGREIKNPLKLDADKLILKKSSRRAGAHAFLSLEQYISNLNSKQEDIENCSSDDNCFRL